MNRLRWPLFSSLVLGSWLAAGAAVFAGETPVPTIVAPSPAGAPTTPATSDADPTIATDPFWPSDGIFPVPGATSSWPGFRGANVRRRTLFAQHRAEEQNAIVFLGDSITEGWKTLADDFSELGVRIANRGIGGDTTPNVVYRLPEDVLSLHPRGLVILIGTNDLGEHTAPAQIADNLRALLAGIRARSPSVPIVWCLVMPRRDTDDYPQRIRELNAHIVALAKSDAGSTVCDTFTALAQEDGTSKPEAFKPDRLHLNDAGYAIWRMTLFPILAHWNLASK